MPAYPNVVIAGTATACGMVLCRPTAVNNTGTMLEQPRPTSAYPSNASTGEWKPYDEARRSTMVFGANTKLENAPRDEERRAWDTVDDKIFGSL